MKAILLLLAISFAATLFGQTTGIGGRFRKSDGTVMKPSSPNHFPMIEFSDQLSISNLTGGSDNTATLEFEIPTKSNVAEFRAMMNARIDTAQVAASKPEKVAVPSTIKRTVFVKAPVNLRQSQPVKIARAEIIVASSDPNQFPKNQLVKTIVLEDVSIESCIDDAATQKSRIKLKGSRIGWRYYNYNKQGARSFTQSGWDIAAGTEWNTF